MQNASPLYTYPPVAVGELPADAVGGDLELRLTLTTPPAPRDPVTAPTAQTVGGAPSLGEVGHVATIFPVLRQVVVPWRFCGGEVGGGGGDC